MEHIIMYTYICMYAYVYAPSIPAIRICFSAFRLAMLMHIIYLYIHSYIPVYITQPQEV